MLLLLHNGLICRPSFITMSRTELYYEACCWEFLCETIMMAQRDSCSFFHTTTPLPPLHPPIPAAFIVPRMASTMPSFSTSMDPEQTKKMAWSASPCRRRYSPGAQKEVLMCSDRERRQPRLAEANSDSSRISLLRCMVMSDRSSSGKSFSSCEDEEVAENETERERRRKQARVRRGMAAVKTQPCCKSVITFPPLVTFDLIAKLLYYRKYQCQVKLSLFT